MQNASNIKTFPSVQHTYFTSIPNFISFMDLSTFAFRLYHQFKLIAGAHYQNECTQSEDTLSIMCNCSTGKISEAKRELLKKGLIVINKRKTKRGDAHSIRVVNVEEVNLEFFKQIKDNGGAPFSSKNKEPRKKPRRVTNTSPKRKKNKEAEVKVEQSTVKIHKIKISKIKNNSYKVNIDWLNNQQSNSTENTNKEKPMQYNEDSVNFDIDSNVVDNEINFEEFVKLHNEKNKNYEKGKVIIDTLSSSFDKEDSSYKKFLQNIDMSVKPSKYETEEKAFLNKNIINNNIILEVILDEEKDMRVRKEKLVSNVKTNIKVKYSDLTAEQKTGMDREHVQANLKYFENLRDNPATCNLIKPELNKSRPSRLQYINENQSNPLEFINNLVIKHEQRRANSATVKDAEFKKSKNTEKNIDTEKASLNKIKPTKPIKVKKEKIVDTNTVEYKLREEYAIAKKISKKYDREELKKYINSNPIFQGINFAREGRWIILLTAKYTLKNIIECLDYLVDLWEQKDTKDIRWRPTCHSIWKNIERFNNKVSRGYKHERKSDTTSNTNSTPIETINPRFSQNLKNNNSFITEAPSIPVMNEQDIVQLTQEERTAMHKKGASLCHETLSKIKPQTEEMLRLEKENNLKKIFNKERGINEINKGSNSTSGIERGADGKIIIHGNLSEDEVERRRAMLEISDARNKRREREQQENANK